VTRPLLTAVLVLSLAACGGQTRRHAEPRLPAPVATDLATYAEDAAAFAAAGDPCAARQQAVALQRATITAINAHRVPAALQEPLQGAVNNLLQRLRCAAPVAQQPKGKGKKHKEEGD
jgi:hypothetical protein